MKTTRIPRTKPGLYSDGGGRITCGKEKCTGMTAFYSGMKYDLHGARIERLRQADVDEFMRVLGRPPRCESCGATDI